MSFDVGWPVTLYRKMLSSSSNHDTGQSELWIIIMLPYTGDNREYQRVSAIVIIKSG